MMISDRHIAYYGRVDRGFEELWFKRFIIASKIRTNTVTSWDSLYQ